MITTPGADTGADADAIADGLAKVERRVILSYAPARNRAGFAALLALDDQLADIVRATRDPMIGQLRLTWWHGALTALDTAPPPAQPVLRALAEHVVPVVAGERLAAMVEGWEALLDDDEPDPAARAEAHASARGQTLFESAEMILGGSANPHVSAAGVGWAAAELAGHSRNPTLAAAAGRLAQERLTGFPETRWPRPMRPLGAMALLARDRESAPAARFGRILYHRITGM